MLELEFLRPDRVGASLAWLQTGILLPRTVLVLPLSGQQDQQALWLTDLGCHVT